MSIRISCVVLLAALCFAGSVRPGAAQTTSYEPYAIPTVANVSQLLLYPNPVEGGKMTTGQVMLSQIAGPGGVVVPLASGNPTAAVVPATVTVPAGANGVTFPITTFPVSDVISVTLVAGGPGSTASGILQVVPPLQTAGNLLVNGSFEEPPIPNGMPWLTLNPGQLPGWRIVAGTVDVHQSWQQAPGQGRQSLGLVGDKAGTIEQGFPTEPGREYLFTGWLSHDHGGGVREGRANVHLNGEFFIQLYHNLPASETNLQWVKFSYRFRASAAVTTLRITDITGITSYQGTVLDGLAVVPFIPPVTPPPVPGPVYNPANGHWYLAVRTTSTVTWPQARAAAAAMAHQGYPGHLAAVTSADEYQFIVSLINQVSGGPYDWWLGGYQDRGVPDYKEPGGGWRWVTGEPWGYTAWKEGEPNDVPHNENAVHISRFGLTWNDLPDTYPLNGYVVEFEAPISTPPMPPAAKAPAAPTNLSAAKITATRVDLTWKDNSDNEQEFILYRKSGGGDYLRIGKVGANITTFSDGGLQPKTTYSYLVRAWNPTGASQRSNELTVQTLAQEPPPPTNLPPKAPSHLVATAISATEISLTWQDNSSDEAAFVLYRKGPMSDFAEIASVPPNTKSYVDRGLKPGTAYRYLVRAWNPKGGASTRSNEASASTPFAQ